MDPGYVVVAVFAAAAVWGIRWYKRYMVLPVRPPLRPTSARTAADGEDAERRASRIARRGQTVFPMVEVTAPLGVFEREETYRAAYELMVRGIDARLVVFPLKGSMGATGFYRAQWGSAGRALVGDSNVGTSVYSTGQLVAHLRGIATIQDFQAYVELPINETCELLVHPDDIQDAREVLAESNIEIYVHALKS